MFDTTSTHITSDQDLEDFGIDLSVIHFNGNYLAWLSNGNNYNFNTSYFNNNYTYASKDDNSGLIIFFYSSSGTFSVTEICARMYPILLYDSIKQVVIYDQSNTYASDTSMSSADQNIGELVAPGDVSFNSRDFTPIPYRALGNSMIKLKGTNNYMYTHLGSFSGVESDSIAAWYGYSNNGQTSASIWNTDITLDDGTILTPIRNYALSNASATNTSYIWICAIKEPTNS